MLSNFSSSAGSSAVALMLAAKRTQRQSGGRQLQNCCYVTKEVGESVFAYCLQYDVNIVEMTQQSVRSASASMLENASQKVQLDNLSSSLSLLTVI